jgi:glucose dehydrogenase
MYFTRHPSRKTTDNTHNCSIFVSAIKVSCLQVCSQNTCSRRLVLPTMDADLVALIEVLEPPDLQ